MQESTKGTVAMVLACVVWGLSGLYYKALSEVPPLEVLAHRTLWSMVFLGVVLALKGRLGELVSALRSSAIWRLLATAVLISVNWFVFIWSVQEGHAIEASFGYYIFPLVAVALGWMVIGEEMSRGQWASVALAGTGVAVLGLGLGVAPWIPLILAATFGAYGLIKKRLSIGSAVSVLGETLLLAPAAFAVLWALHEGWMGDGQGGHFGREIGQSVMLAFSGVLTGGPLMLFSYAAQRVRMATVGLVQYLNPTLQFAVAALAFGEPVTIWHAIALGLIWAAIAIYSALSLRARPRRARA